MGVIIDVAECVFIEERRESIVIGESYSSETCNETVELYKADIPALIKKLKRVMKEPAYKE